MENLVPGYKVHRCWLAFVLSLKTTFISIYSKLQQSLLRVILDLSTKGEEWYFFKFLLDKLFLVFDSFSIYWVCILGGLRYLASRNWYSDKYYNAHKRHTIINNIWKYINMSSSSWERYPGRSPSRWTVQDAMGSCVDRRHQGVLSSSRGLPAWHWGRWAIWACLCALRAGVRGGGTRLEKQNSSTVKDLRV